MAKRGQYRTYNLSDPEHGMKYYDPNDPNMKDDVEVPSYASSTDIYERNR